VGRVVARDPVNSAAWYDLGIAHEIMNEFDKAEHAYRAAEKITPKPAIWKRSAM